jgi:TolB-like protein
MKFAPGFLHSLLTARRCRFSFLAVPLLLSACATATPKSSPPPAAEIPALEARHARERANLPIMVRLGLAYRQANQFEQARAVLERAAERYPNDPSAVLFLGLTYEDLGSYSDARKLYERYARTGRSRAVRAQVRSRIPLLERKELEAAVRSSLQREAELASTRPEQRNVAVYPFLYTGDNAELRPLSRALAELLVTDLSQTNRLTVLERARVQMLLDEIKLAESGLVDAATASRSGRLLGAGRIIQGRIEGGEDLLRLQAAVVDVTGDGAAAPLAEQDAIRRLFEMQKRLVFGIFRSLNVSLSEAERARISRQPTSNLQALLAYGLGLEAEDGGSFELAAQHFARAASLDPGFTEARVRGERASELAAATRVTTMQLAQMGAVELGLPPVTTPFAMDAIRELVPQGPRRDPTAELLGQDAVGNRAIIEVILRRP